MAAWPLGRNSPTSHTHSLSSLSHLSLTCGPHPTAVNASYSFSSVLLCQPTPSNKIAAGFAHVFSPPWWTTSPRLPSSSGGAAPPRQPPGAPAAQRRCRTRVPRRAEAHAQPRRSFPRRYDCSSTVSSPLLSGSFYHQCLQPFLRWSNVVLQFSNEAHKSG